MTVQEGPGGLKERILRKDYPVVEGTDFGTTKQTGKKELEPEESFVNRVGKGFQ